MLISFAYISYCLLSIPLTYFYMYVKLAYAIEL